MRWGHHRLRGRVALMTCADDDAERSDEVGAPPGRSNSCASCAGDPDAYGPLRVCIRSAGRTAARPAPVIPTHTVRCAFASGRPVEQLRVPRRRRAAAAGRAGRRRLDRWWAGWFRGGGGRRRPDGQGGGGWIGGGRGGSAAAAGGGGRPSTGDRPTSCREGKVDVIEQLRDRGHRQVIARHPAGKARSMSSSSYATAAIDR